MTTLIKALLKKADDQMKIEKKVGSCKYFKI